MRTRIALMLATFAFVAMATAAPASADAVPGKPNQFYAYCTVNLLGTPIACTETDEASASHICQYVLTGIGIGLDCIQV